MTTEQAALVWKAIESAWRRDEPALQLHILDLCDIISDIAVDRMRFEIAESHRRQNRNLVARYGMDLRAGR